MTVWTQGDMGHSAGTMSSSKPRIYSCSIRNLKMNIKERRLAGIVMDGVNKPIANRERPRGQLCDHRADIRRATNAEISL